MAMEIATTTIEAAVDDPITHQRRRRQQRWSQPQEFPLRQHTFEMIGTLPIRTNISTTKTTVFLADTMSHFGTPAQPAMIANQIIRSDALAQTLKPTKQPGTQSAVGTSSGPSCPQIPLQSKLDREGRRM